MNRKKVNIILGALLLVSLIGNGVIYKQMAKAEVAVNTAQAELNKQQEVSNKQNAELDKAKKTLDEDKAKNAELKEKLAKTPSDPNKLLKSGITLLDLRMQIDSMISLYEANGDSVGNHMAEINKHCADQGTTYSEVQRVPESAILARKQAQEQAKLQAQQQAQAKAQKAAQAKAQQQAQAKQSQQATQPSQQQQTYTPPVQQQAPQTNDGWDIDTKYNPNGYGGTSGATRDINIE